MTLSLEGKTIQKEVLEQFISLVDGLLYERVDFYASCDSVWFIVLLL